MRVMMAVAVLLECWARLIVVMLHGEVVCSSLASLFFVLPFDLNEKF